MNKTADDVRKLMTPWCVGCGRKLKKKEAETGRGVSCARCIARLIKK